MDLELQWIYGNIYRLTVMQSKRGLMKVSND